MKEEDDPYGFYRWVRRLYDTRAAVMRSTFPDYGPLIDAVQKAYDGPLLHPSKHPFKQGD